MKFSLPIAVFGIAWSCVAPAADPDFSDVIRPILSENCFHCHGPDKNDRKADLRLDTAEGAKRVLGEPAKSELLMRVLHDDPDEIMPPPKSKLSLSESEKASLKAWIASGGHYEEHWSFVPPVRPPVPEDGKGVKNPIDAFIGKRLKEEGLDFSPEADPHRLIRRATLDLTGLPPTVGEVDAFLEDYRSDGDRAYDALVDRLLASPRYGETMALPWLDAARFADTDGYQFDGPRFMWRWRDWVIDAYHRGMPFDQFTIEQLAGDLLPNPTLDQKIATGFNRNHRYNSEAGLVVEEYLLENAVDRVDTTATLWMGLTMGCARCHDHKYDPISQKDYYQLIAFFNSVPEAGRAVKARNSEPVILAPTKEQQPILAAKEKALEAARAALRPGSAPQNGGLLIDRRILHHYPLDRLPEKSAKAEGAVSFRDKSMILDGQSQVAIGGIDKRLSFRANHEFTISFWLKPGSVGDSVILSRQNSGTTRPGVELALVEGGRLRFDLISRWLAGAGRVVTKEPLVKDRWVHVAVSNDGSQSANGQLIFIGGQRAEVVTFHNTNSNVGGVSEKSPLLVGGGIRPKSKRLVGAIRDLRLYETDLWPGEIEILAAPYGGPKRQEFSRITTTEQYRAYVRAREDLEAYRKTLPTVMVMRDSSEPKPTYIRNRGVYNDLGARVERDVPGAFPSWNDDLPKESPRPGPLVACPRSIRLTARVAVNRYWQKYFGTGLVKTSEDFGVQGEIPSHPELLDWLAVEFRESGWDIAAMQKLIVTSRTYRQAARQSPDIAGKGSGQSPPGARTADSPERPCHPRPGALCLGAAQGENWRSLGQSLSTRQLVGRNEHGDEIQAIQGRRPVSAQHLHDLEANRGASHDGPF